MIIRLAVEADAGFIARLIQQSFDANMLRAMIYGCHGIINYIRYNILTPNKISDTVYMVAEDRGSIVGCVELRLVGKAIFLNYICIDHNKRHKGIGRELLLNSIYIIGNSFYNKMNLDVFYDNVVAKSWYENIDFTYEYTTSWLSISMNPCENIRSGKISGIAQSNICQREFGFSHFILNTTTASYSVGRLGTDWFRISDETLLKDDQAIATLCQLDSNRKILGLFRENINGFMVEEFKPFCRSVRMAVDINLLLNNLTN